ncbi:DUF4422 domain-containing protein [Absiella sp. AM29-15]|uniref:DUF4422 domain-containing protein n=1 Tax=Absiella sp. AM29-15 TaxID=2292278 RepID=UPI001F31D9B7|nr:DUF4422 domain-containing protein [Absiella sp. AM29-15]
MNIKIIVATHKKYQMPIDDIYLPVHVGAEGKESIGYQPDSVGNNISNKNANFCELTGLYWAWQNLKADYIGLVHYRRHFKSKIKSKNKFDKIAKRSDIEPLLKQADVIVPNKRNYYIETIYSHYAHTLHEEDLVCARRVIENLYPDYLLAYDIVMKRKSAHMFNMMIIKKNLLDEYCEWLFDILFEIEKKLNVSNYTTFEARVYGRISELLLDVWLTKNKIDFKELPVIHMEKINWIKKGWAFILAKITHKKYKGSF